MTTPLPSRAHAFALSRQPRLRAAIYLCESTFSTGARLTSGAVPFVSRMMILTN